MTDDKFDPRHILAAAFAISSLGGLAALLRSNRTLSWRVVAAALLYSGISGLTIALIWYNNFSENGNIYFLLGVSGLAGIGGTTVIDFAIQYVKHIVQVGGFVRIDKLDELNKKGDDTK